jgi:hypothetical protein
VEKQPLLRGSFAEQSGEEKQPLLRGSFAEQSGVVTLTIHQIYGIPDQRITRKNDQQLALFVEKARSIT